MVKLGVDIINISRSLLTKITIFLAAFTCIVRIDEYHMSVCAYDFYCISDQGDVKWSLAKTLIGPNWPIIEMYFPLCTNRIWQLKCQCFLFANNNELWFCSRNCQICFESCRLVKKSVSLVSRQADGSFFTAKDNSSLNGALILPLLCRF